MEEKVGCKGKEKGRKKENTHNQGSNGHISPVDHPKGPGCEPPIAFSRGHSKNLFSEETVQNGALVAFVNASNSDRELQILKLVEADIDCVLKVVCEKEESCGVFLLGQVLAGLKVKYDMKITTTDRHTKSSLAHQGIRVF
jgi:hypothetical protein